MGSLADQLLKAGLANKEKAQRANAEKRKKNKKKQAGHQVVDEVQLQVQQAEAERLRRDRELNRQQHEARLKREAQARIRQIVEQHRLQEIAGEREFNFADDNRVRKIALSDGVYQGLVSGTLAIARADKGYVVIPSAIADKLAEIDRQVIVPLPEPESAADADDPYADYQIPDDLMW